MSSGPPHSLLSALGVSRLARVTTMDRCGVEVMAVGTELYGVEPLPDPAAALAAIGPLGDGDAVLVKGSRVAGLERVAEALIG